MSRRAAAGTGAASLAFAMSYGRTEAAAATPVADTTAGQVSGYLDGRINVFKGVPYGAPTGGAARWLPPKKPAAWSNVRACTEYGPMCPQIFGAPLAEENTFLQTGPMSEDCLNLNVWTPAVGGVGRRPVMVWFHGGGFAGGSGAATTYDGVNLATKHDIVLVTVTHRLNVFGFLYLGQLAGPAYADSGIAGMLDCVLALEWVRDNIAAFGGDPNNVTIFGQSGGGAKVTTLMAMPAAKGLFHRVIAQSGFALRSSRPPEATETAKAILSKAGLGLDQLTRLQSTPPSSLIAALEAVPGLAYAIAPVVDGRNLLQDPFSPTAPPTSAGVPMMLGSTETEVTFLADTPLEAIDDDALRETVKRFTGQPQANAERLIAAYRAEYPGRDNTYLYQVLASDWWFTADARTTAERKAAQGAAPAYLYYFDKQTPVRNGKLRSPHTLEIPYAFDNLARGAAIVGPATAKEQALADRLSRTWTTFARTGNPNNPSLPHWQPYDVATRPVMVLDDTPRVVQDPHPNLRALISQIKQA